MDSMTLCLNKYPNLNQSTLWPQISHPEQSPFLRPFFLDIKSKHGQIEPVFVCFDKLHLSAREVIPSKRDGRLRVQKECSPRAAWTRTKQRERQDDNKGRCAVLNLVRFNEGRDMWSDLSQSSKERCCCFCCPGKKDLCSKWFLNFVIRVLRRFFMTFPSVLHNSHPVNWSVETNKKETRRDYKNYHGVSDLVHKKQKKSLQSALNVSYLTESAPACKCIVVKSHRCTIGFYRRVDHGSIWSCEAIKDSLKRNNQGYTDHNS